ncbi:N-acetylglucosaminyl-phosphatidylinositol de-N-acetylase [Friedmanniomyces endolithicus]|nr:N-acetylglucosaminyl-phosphatidylinositol de-N-acetylase [Friedmanniomyces endolithicus]
MTTFTLPIDYLIALQLFGLILVVWLFTWHMSRSFPTLHNKRICLLIAHPDDEAMFFGPAVQWLTRPELGNQLLILCLSSGDAAGLGHIRKTELRHSALLLGVKSPDHVVVIEDAAKLPDSMTAVWDPKLIASILTRYFAPTLAGAPTTAAPPASLDAILTFDRQGVSGHPNHTALFHGSALFLRHLMARHTGWECPVRLYTLGSVNVSRKYSSVLDAATTVLTCIWWRK